MGKVTLREHIEALRESDQHALEVATDALNKRLDLLNELRGNVITREEYIAKHEALLEVVDALKDRVTRSEGKGQGYNASWAIVLAVVTIMIAIAAVVVVVVTRG